ncbi:MAG: GNAT family N-acetyltransferase [Clostridiaceae bacterium]|nr:GNAT family N-acetyltransferase [Clostridiaceae bacterium]
MTILRELKISDSEHMIGFIRDPEVAKHFLYTRYPMSKEKFEHFIRESWGNRDNVHFAIESDDGEYAGTVSLKSINYVDMHAEYAIAVRKELWGTGIAKDATEAIIDYGFKKLNLNKIYLNVLATNERANKFYQKIGFEFEGTFKKHLFIDGEHVDLNWYCVFRP